MSRNEIVSMLRGKSGAGSLLTEVSRDTCDPCICALVDVFIPALAADGFDLAEAGGFTAAEALLTSCITVLFAPLTRAQ